MSHPTMSLIRENFSQFQWGISSACCVSQTFSQYVENSENNNINVSETEESNLEGIN